MYGRIEKEPVGVRFVDMEDGVLCGKCDSRYCTCDYRVNSPEYCTQFNHRGTELRVASVLLAGEIESKLKTIIVEILEELAEEIGHAESDCSKGEWIKREDVLGVILKKITEI